MLSRVVHKDSLQEFETPSPREASKPTEETIYGQVPILPILHSSAEVDPLQVPCQASTEAQEELLVKVRNLG